MDALIERIRQGDRRSLARAMSLVDASDREARTLRDALRRFTGDVPWWGFTGPPGVGKSTLIDSLLALLRECGRRVGVVAVDPTSPFSDGALLGDRVRMMRHAVDPGVFIRSLATQRCPGGLSAATLHCARLLETGGYDPVLIETVGVGQNEADVAGVAGVCVVILGPGYGDDIQLIKAGLLEIADIVVVNKCELPEANRLLSRVREELGPRSTAREDPNRDDSMNRRIEAVGVEAKTGRGVEALLNKLLELDRSVRQAGRREQLKYRRMLGEIERGARLAFEAALRRGLNDGAAVELIARLKRGELSLESAVAQINAAVLSELSGRAGDPPGQSPQ